MHETHAISVSGCAETIVKQFAHDCLNQGWGVAIANDMVYVKIDKADRKFYNNLIDIYLRESLDRRQSLMV